MSWQSPRRRRSPIKTAQIDDYKNGNDLIPLQTGTASIIQMLPGIQH